MQQYQPPEYIQKLQSKVDTVIDSLKDSEHRLEESIENTWQSLETSYKKRLNRRRRRARLIASVGLTLWIIALLFLVLIVMPQIAYSLFPGATDRVSALIGETVDIDKSGFGEVVYEVEKSPEAEYVPPLDPTLPLENRLIIETIGVDTIIGEGEDWEEVLKDGVWRAPELGDPENNQLPIIMAAHRFGYLYWTNQFRRQSSFYNLPKLENGDEIKIIWNQRQYTYEIYEGYTDTKLRDVEADLILFTCQVLNSDRRIIRKARLIVPEGFARSVRWQNIIGWQLRAGR